MSVVEDQAEQVCRESLERAMANSAIREPTRRNMLKIDEACRQIQKNRGELTIANVLRTLADLYPGDYPAEQSIRNKTISGDSYREVVAIWRTYQLALARTKKVRTPAPTGDDLPDILLNQLQPEGARMVVLSMRTALRNMRQQFQIIKALNPEHLIQRESTTGSRAKELRPDLTQEEREIVTAFVDTTETASRGLEWDDLGRLLGPDGEALSRPGLLHVLMKILNRVQFGTEGRTLGCAPSYSHGANFPR
jgi:hypothetical protein